MKIKSILGILVSGVVLYSCNQKENNISPENDIQNTNVKIESGRLCINEADYRELFNDTTLQNDILEKESSTQFTSINEASSRKQNIRTTVNTTVEYPEFLQKILNTDGIVQIGSYLIRVNLEKEKVFCLDVAHNNEYQDLVNENINNENIFVFSTEQNVIDELALLKNKNAKMDILCFRERGADSKKDDDFVNYGDGYRLDCKVVYQNAGIYFSLQAKVKNQVEVPRGSGLWFAQKGNLSLNYYDRYKPKCKSEISPETGTRYEIDNELNHRAWESATALNKYHYRVQFSNLAGNVTTRVFEIKYGY